MDRNPDPELLTLLIDTIPLGAVIWRVEDPEDGGALRMVRPNAAASKASGVDLSRFQGMTMAEAFPAFVESGLADRVLRTTIHRGEVLTLGKLEYNDDRTRAGIFEMSACRLDEHHLVIQYISVTEREELVEELAAQNRELLDAREHLRAANRELEQFAHIASHDLQAPARRVMSYLSRVLDGGAVEEEARRHIERAMASARRMHELVGALLSYARAGNAPLQEEDSSLLEVLRQATLDLDLELEEAGATLHLPERDWQVVGPRDLLTQVFANLLSNALKYRSPERPLVVEISARLEGERLRVDVRDNGLGFDDEAARRIFRPFERLHSHSEIPGSGMGLGLVRRVVNRVGGRVAATGRPGEGCTISVWLRPGSGEG